MSMDHKPLQILAHRSEKAGFLMLHNVDFDFGHDDSLADKQLKIRVYLDELASCLVAGR